MKRARFGRRGLFRATFAVSALSLAPSSMATVQAVSPAPADPPPLEPLPFIHGVASGDPLPTSVVLWTRVTPSPEALPGSGLGPDVRVRWEVSPNPDFAHITAAGEATASAEHDHTLHIDPFGLEPATTYYYRFGVVEGEHAGQWSPVGKTATAPADDDAPESLRIALCSCANYESGFFSAYAEIARAAQRDEIDIVVHMGDYLYEYASGYYTGKFGVQRAHVPEWTLTKLSDYRARYGHYRRDEDLQAAHAAAPWVVTWDDHEIANNAHVDGAEGHHPTRHGDYHQRRDAAMQAYLEWLPVRGHSPSRGGRIYRTLRFGKLAELHMLDLRSYRSQPAVLRRFDPSATIMGSEQFEWLEGQLRTSAGRWNLIGTSVMMAPLNLLALEPLARGPIATITGASDAATAEGEKSIAANPDQWDGYTADRARLLRSLATHHPHGRTLFLTGDIHSEWANEIWQDQKLVGAEMVCSSISAPNVDDMLNLPVDSTVSQSAEKHIRVHNPHVHHVDLDAHGFALLELRSDQAQMTWYRVEDLYRPGSAVQPAARASYDGTGIAL